VRVGEPRKGMSSSMNMAGRQIGRRNCVLPRGIRMFRRNFGDHSIGDGRTVDRLRVDENIRVGT
jgi:hypothetical protein